MTNPSKSNTELFREASDIIRVHGHRIDGYKSADTEIFDLRGVGRVDLARTGQRMDITLMASGAHFEASSWRGQFNNVSMTESTRGDLERVVGNARNVKAIIDRESKVAEHRTQTGQTQNNNAQPAFHYGTPAYR